MHAVFNRRVISFLFFFFFPSGTVDAEASDDVEASEPVQSISVVYSLRRSSNKRKKDKGKAVAVPVSTTPNLKISDSR